MSSYLRSLMSFAATQWPKPAPSLDNPEKVRQDWVVRFVADGPEEENLLELSELLNRAVIERAKQVHSELEIRMDESSIPLVRVSRIDRLHLIVHIDLQKPELDVTNSWLVAAGEALRTLHLSYGIEDLQGIPRAYWLFMGDNN